MNTPVSPSQLTPPEIEQQAKGLEMLTEACRILTWDSWHGKKKPRTRLTIIAENVLEKVAAPRNPFLP